MFVYKAYELGGKIAYPVSQIRWEGDEKYIAFNGSWYKETECILCAGTGIKDSDKNEIYYGDILQLNIFDDSCYYKGKIGIVNFYEGRFLWKPIDGWSTYSLAGKSWKKIGHISNIGNISNYYTDKQMEKNSILKNIITKLSGYYKGVFFEKHKTILHTNTGIPNIYSFNHQSKKQEKTLLHQYKNYLKIKKMIENGEIHPEIMNSNLGIIQNENDNCKK